MEKSSFQFKGFSIDKALFDTRDSEEASEDVSIKIHPSGVLKEDGNLFTLKLHVIIEDKNEVFKVEIEAFGNFRFVDDVDIDSLDNMFYINAPAILFPYLRAYISTLTHLSGWTPLTLPTLNMTNLADELRENCETI